MLFVIDTWPIWAAVAAAIIGLVWMQLHIARKDPLLVDVQRGDDRVVFRIVRRMWAKPFPAEAAKDRRVVIDGDGRTAQVRFYDPKTQDEDQLALRLSETQDTAAWWAYRMKGGEDDVDKAIVIASALAERNLSTRKQGQEA